MFELAKCAKVDSSPELGTLQIQESITYGLLINHNLTRDFSMRQPSFMRHECIFVT